MRIFITGVAGFLGCHLAKRLHDLGHQIVGNDNMIGGDEYNIHDFVEFHNVDCCDFENMKRIMKNCDVVYHCAATAHEGFSVFSPSLITRNTFDASISTFSAAIACNVKRIVFCSSMARYGGQKTPFTEDMKAMPVDPYGIAKVASEETLKVLCDVHGVEWMIAVPHNIVGPNQKYDDPFRNVMSIMLNRNLMNQPAIIYGDGTQTRCFSYIDDCIICLEKMGLSSSLNREIINIGPDEEFITINHLATLCANETGFNGATIYYDSGRPLEVKHAICSSDKARTLLNYETSTTVKDAVKFTANFIRSRGTKPFNYYLPIEINNDKIPKTWTERRI